MRWKRLVITSGAFLALSAALAAVTTPIFRQAECQSARPVQHVTAKSVDKG